VIVSQLLDFERSQPSAAVAALGQPGGYAIDTVIGRRPSLWGITFDYKDYPWEMGVHFPTFYVLKAGALR